MENKEQFEQFTAHIKRLEKLTEDILEKAIYPVAFFSEAFDITGRMQALLHQMEVLELMRLERQAKAHQAQIQSIGRISNGMTSPSNTALPESRQTPAPPVTNPPAAASPPPPLRCDMPLPSPPPPKRAMEKPESRLNETIGKNRLADLKKAFTLNDRFRFCHDLFGKNENLMNQTIAELNTKDSYETSLACLKERFNWNFEDETVAEFVAILEKRFS
ncbi:MAG: hypothetical protein LBP50_03860 [Tannerella sp.]|jgi:hypothetical protein|nr:hypothetical protein [Tannerella sp.]